MLIFNIFFQGNNVIKILNVLKEMYIFVFNQKLEEHNAVANYLKSLLKSSEIRAVNHFDICDVGSLVNVTACFHIFDFNNQYLDLSPVNVLITDNTKTYDSDLLKKFNILLGKSSFPYEAIVKEKILLNEGLTYTNILTCLQQQRLPFFRKGTKCFDLYGKICNYSRIRVNDYQTKIKETHRDFFSSLAKTKRTTYSLDVLNENFPSVSVVTLTHNRSNFTRLMKKSFENLTKGYPAKVQWIIIDDSSQPNEELQSEPSYFFYGEKMSIGKKRNIGVEKAECEWLCMMDDDDYYVEYSLLSRMNFLLQNKKSGTYCTSIACYDVLRDTSFINLPPLERKLNRRISEASLLFHKTVWEKNMFTEGNGEEASNLIDVNCMIEVPWYVCLVSIIHNKNTSTRQTPIDVSPNGNTFILDKEYIDILKQAIESTKVSVE
jgi:glycosyltransferase involved in cell wall biosynthesis